MGLRFRSAVASDAAACGKILFDAFTNVAKRHGFPEDGTLEGAVKFAEHILNHPEFFGAVAEQDSQVVAVNVLDERDPIRAVGPIAVAPSAQGCGIGRGLMEAVLKRVEGYPGVRLLQDAFNTRSLALFASLGFEVKEPLALVQGKPKIPPIQGFEVRRMKEEDIAACETLCCAVHGFERTHELRDALADLTPLVALRHGHVTAYTSAISPWQSAHGVAETFEDMKALLLGAAAQFAEPISFALPTRQSALFRWCLAEGFRVIKPLTLMARGEYHEPRGCYFPSASY
jgi:GNAT superfamily N-acetyltransferase